MKANNEKQYWSDSIQHHNLHHQHSRGACKHSHQPTLCVIMQRTRTSVKRNRHVPLTVCGWAIPRLDNAAPNTGRASPAEVNTIQ